MARPARINVDETTVTDKEAESTIADFLANSGGGIKQIQIYKTGESGRPAHCVTLPAPEDSAGWDRLNDKIKREYGGGDYIYKLTIDSKIAKTATVSLMTPIAAPNVVTNNGGTSNELLIAMMNMQQQSSTNMMQVMMQMQQSQTTSMTTMLAAIIPAIAGNKGESAGALLAQMAQVQKELNPPKENSMQETLGLLKLAKELLPGESGSGNDDGDGIGSLVKAASPLLGSIVGALASQPRPQAPQAPQPAQVQTPQIQQTPQPAPAPQPSQESQEQMNAQAIIDQLKKQYDPVMIGVKTMLLKKKTVDEICDYIDGQLGAGIIEREDFDGFLELIAANKDQLPQLAGLWDITEHEYIQKLSAVIDEYNSADDLDGEGEQIDETNPSDNGGNSAEI